LRHYPDSGGARLFRAQQKAQFESLEAAVDELRCCLDQFPMGRDQTAAWILLCKWALQLNRTDLVALSRRELSALTLDDPLDDLQVALLLEPWEQVIESPAVAFAAGGGERDQQAGSVCFLIPCDDVAEFEDKKSSLLLNLSGGAWSVEVQRCSQNFRDHAYREVLNSTVLPDVMVIMQRNVDIMNPRFLQLVEEGLVAADVLACAGALHWDRFSWRDAPFTQKFGGFFMSSPSASEAELQMFGAGLATTSPLLQVLDGHLLAFRPAYMRQFSFDPEMNGPETLVEEDWVHQAALAGARLRAVRTLGVSMQEGAASNHKALAPAR
jgi:hypothetical protein